MGFIDNFLAAVSPRRACEREAWRQQLEILRSYDAAGFGRLNAGWRVHNESAELTDRNSRDVVRARARDLERNSDIAQAILYAYKRNVVGKGYTLRAKTGDDALNKEIELAWKRWCKARNCDVTGEQSFNQLAELAQSRYRVKTIKFAKEFKYRYATKSRLEAVLVSSGEPLSTSKFKTSPATPSISGKGSPPVKIAILASNSPKKVTNSRGLDAFLTRFQSGHVAVVQRKPPKTYTEKGWNDRQSRHRDYQEATGKLDKTRIREFYGPSVPTMLRKTGISEKFIETTRPKLLEYLEAAVTTHINREIHFASER